MTPEKIDLGKYFHELNEKFEKDKCLFENFKIKLKSFLKKYDDNNYIESNELHIVYDLANKTFFKNSIPMFISVHTYIKSNVTIVFSNINNDLEKEILELSNYFVPIIEKSHEIHNLKEKDASLTLRTFKEIITQRTYKNFKIIIDWITKWGSYLQAENNFNPQKLKAYKQGEILLIDFGFRIGNELGGRHYAIVLEKNNNPNSGMIILVPLSSYDPINEKPHKADFDLGIGVIPNSNKGTAAKISQIGNYSKLRIEKPLSTNERIGRIDSEQVTQLISLYTKKLGKEL